MVEVIEDFDDLIISQSFNLERKKLLKFINDGSILNNITIIWFKYY